MTQRLCDDQMNVFHKNRIKFNPANNYIQSVLHKWSHGCRIWRTLMTFFDQFTKTLEYFCDVIYERPHSIAVFFCFICWPLQKELSFKNKASSQKGSPMHGLNASKENSSIMLTAKPIFIFKIKAQLLHRNCYENFAFFPAKLNSSILIFCSIFLSECFF